MVRKRKRKRVESKRLPRTIYVVKAQSGGRKSINRDLSRYAMPPGKRLSITGKVYWETRKNRSDKKPGRL